MFIPTRKKFTIEDYHRLLDVGFFSENSKIELIRGEIIEMSPKRTPHSVCNSRLWRELYKLIDQQAIIRVQEPIIISTFSEPEPDLVIAKHRNDEYLSSHPKSEDILLVIEIADSTLKYDQETKLALYAEAEIKDYWIFNLINNYLETYTNPGKISKERYDYRTRQIVLANESITIPHFAALNLDLNLVFPDQ